MKLRAIVTATYTVILEAVCGTGGTVTVGANDAMQQRALNSVESADRHRARARSVSTICAAAAGALASGLIFVQNQNLPQSPKVFGVIAVGLLIASTSIGMAASVATTYHNQKSTRLSKILNFVSLWRISYNPQPPCDGEDENSKIVDEARVLKAGISKVTSYSLWCAGMAAVTVLITIGCIAFPKENLVKVDVYVGNSGNFEYCPGANSVIQARASKSDLGSQAKYIQLKIAASECDVGKELTIYVDRTQLQLVG